MNERTTQADIRAAFERAIPADQRASDFGAGGTNAHNIGRHALDYNPTYGGWVIITFAGGDSGAGYAHGRNQFGDRRRAGRAMLDFLNGITAGRELGS